MFRKMKEKRKDCLYCGNEMKEVKTVRKKFCSDLCRVNFNNDLKYENEIRKVLENPVFNKLKRDTIFNLIVYGQYSIPEEKLKEIAENATLPLIKKKDEFENEVFVGNFEIKKPQNKPITAPKKEKQVNTPQKQKEAKFEPQGAAENGMPVKMEGESAIDYKIRLENWKEQLKNK